jgi:hypothetical protein
MVTPGELIAARDKEIAGLKTAAKEDVAQLARMCNEVVRLREALAQAVEQLEVDYVHTPLDGHGALIRKLKSTLGIE